MDKSKIEKLNPLEYTHLPHEEQKFEDHEQTDVAIRPLAWTLVAIAVIIAVSAIGLWGLFHVFKTVADHQTENQRFSAVEGETRAVPAGLPPLQGIPTRSTHERAPAQDMDELRKENALILAGKKPMREGLEKGMSIDEAMDMALSRKIFKTAPATTQPRQQQQAQSR
jgi:hypothetical protein